MDGLPADYNPLVTSIISRLDPYSIEEMEALLMTIEARIKKCNIMEAGSLNLSLRMQASVTSTC